MISGGLNVDNSYFDYIIYLAFDTILSYEDKRTLTIEQLHNYRVKFCELCQDKSDWFEQFGEEVQSRFNDFLRINMNMPKQEENDKFAHFLKEQKNIFSYQFGIISLDENISLQELEDRRFELECYTRDKTDKVICGSIQGLRDNLECLKILGANKIIEYISKIIKVEKIIEDSYHSFENPDSQNSIRIGNIFIASKLKPIFNTTEEKMRCFTRIMIKFDDPSSFGEEFWLLSEHLENNDEFYQRNTYINNDLCNKFQRAIFDTGTLMYDQIKGYSDMLWTFRKPKDELDFEQDLEPVEEDFDWDNFFNRLAGEDKEEFIDEFEDASEEETDEEEDYEETDSIILYRQEEKIYLAFYIRFIETLNEYQSKYGIKEELQQAKNRLLYLLDIYGHELYKEENFRKISSGIRIDNFDIKKDFYDYYVMSRLFLIDILEGYIDDERTVRKILFASTYYNLTKDRRIKRILNKYKNTELGKKVYAAIINNDYSNFRNLSSPNLTRELKKKNEFSENKN